MTEMRFLPLFITVATLAWQNMAFKVSKFRRIPALADSSFMIRLSGDQVVTEAEMHTAKRKGPNMCVERRQKKPQDSRYYCDIVMGRYVCRRGRRLFHTVYHCCPGYRREKGKRGCPKEKHWSNRHALKALKQQRLTAFLDIARRTHLQRFVKEQKSITLLIPSNEAWQKWKTSEDGRIIWENDYLLRLTILNHVIGGKWPSIFLNDLDRLETIRPVRSRQLRVKFFRRKKIMMIEGALVLKKDISASNAVIHIIDKVIYPPRKTVMQLLSMRPELREFTSSFKRFRYNVTGRTTIFAPTNKAFRELAEGTRGRMSTRLQCLKELVFIHVIENIIYLPVLKIMSRPSIVTVQGNRLMFEMKNGALSINGIAVKTKFFGAKDGAIYIIDKLLTPASALTTMDVLSSIPNTGKMLQLMKDHNLESRFNAINSNTSLFVPYDNTFRSKGISFFEQLRSNRSRGRQFLDYHMTPGRVKTGSLHNEQLIPTYLDQNKLRINFYNRRLTTSVQGACMDFKRKDIETCNGVIHVLNWKYLTPPVGTIFDIIYSNPRLTVLRSAIQIIGLIPLLSSDTPLTLFAPVDEAWRKLKGFKLYELFEDNEGLTALVKYHIIPGTMYRCGLGRQRKYHSLNGRAVRITRQQGRAIGFNYARTISTEISATNGVVHVIDSLVMYLSKEVLTSYG